MNTTNSSILGLGHDILEIDRMRKAYARHGVLLLDRLLLLEEQAYCLQFQDPIPRIAARFSAKEAIAKALGTGFGQELSFLDIEIKNNQTGKPFVELSPRANLFFHNPKILLSISHCKAYVSTTAILVSC